MELLYIALPISLLIAAGFLAAFLWAARDDQFDDLDSPARRMLHEQAPLRDPSALDRQESGAESARASGPGQHMFALREAHDRVGDA